MAKGVYLHKPENYPPSRKGVRLSEEHKLKVSESLKGNTWNRGRKHTEKSTQLKKINCVRSAAGKTGRNHPAWKEEKVTPLRRQIRHCFLYRQWRSDVFTRDNFTCVLCGNKRGGNLNADHFPKMFSEIVSEYNIKTLDEAISCEELWNINNGRTLCVPCHKETPTFRRKKKAENM